MPAMSIAGLEHILRLLLAAVLGCAIGLDRERHPWNAGMRTHMLVSVGAALFMLVSMYGFVDVVGTPGVTFDASRVAAQVASGIGFLGAGAIIVRRDVIHGLTTAASLWVVAAIGLAAGGGLYLAATAATLLTLLILVALKPIEQRLFGERRAHTLVVVADNAITSLVAIEAALRQANVQTGYLRWRINNDLVSNDLTNGTGRPNRTQFQVEIAFTELREAQIAAVMDSLRAVPGVSAVRRMD
jgi:putative Mg2+ transporter-C (MgtC) family protein